MYYQLSVEDVMKETPLSRKEMYLSNIAGEDTPIPVPMNREERYYKKIIEGLKNACKSGLPEITENLVDVSTQRSYQFFSVEGGGFYGAHIEAFVMKLGREYIVHYDGTDYRVKAYLYGPSGRNLLMGNTSFVGGEDTGEPFLIVYTPDQELEPVSMGVRTSEASHVVGVKLVDTIPEEGSAPVVVNGEWKMQSGMGFTDDLRTVPFDRALIPLPVIRYKGHLHKDIVPANSFTIIHVYADNTPRELQGIILYVEVYQEGDRRYPLIFETGTLNGADASTVRVYNPTSEPVTIEADDVTGLYKECYLYIIPYEDEEVETSEQNPM